MSKFSRAFLKKTVVSAVTISLFAIAAAVASSLIFASQSIKQIAISEEKMSLYNDTQYDYVLYNLTDGQLDGVKTSAATNNYAEFYKTLGVMQTPKGNVDISVRSTKELNKISLTEYTDARIISKKDVADNNAYISSTFAKTYSVSIGYSFKLGGIDFVISRIYRDSKDTSVVYIPDFGQKMKDKFGEELQVNGLYVDSKDNASSESSFQTLGITQIENKNEKYNENKQDSDRMMESAKKNFLLMGILAGGIYLLGTAFYLLVSLKSIKREVVDSGRHELFVRTNISHGIGAALALINCFVAVLIIKSSSNLFVGTSTILSNALFGLVLILAFAVASYICNLLLVRLVKSEKKQDGLEEQ